MNATNISTTAYALRPSMPPEYKERIDLYMKEYRKQHNGAFIDAQKRYREAHKNDEPLRQKRCEYSKKHYYKIKDTRPPKTEEQKAREKEYHKKYYEKIKQERVHIKNGE